MSLAHTETKGETLMSNIFLALTILCASLLTQVTTLYVALVSLTGLADGFLRGVNTLNSMPNLSQIEEFA